MIRTNESECEFWLSCIRLEHLRRSRKWLEKIYKNDEITRCEISDNRTNHWSLFAGGRISCDWVRDREKLRLSSGRRVDLETLFIFLRSHLSRASRGIFSGDIKSTVLHRDFVTSRVSNFLRKSATALTSSHILQKQSIQLKTSWSMSMINSCGS